MTEGGLEVPALGSRVSEVKIAIKPILHSPVVNNHLICIIWQAECRTIAVRVWPYAFAPSTKKIHREIELQSQCRFSMELDILFIEQQSCNNNHLRLNIKEHVACCYKEVTNSKTWIIYIIQSNNRKTTQSAQFVWPWVIITAWMIRQQKELDLWP